MNGFYKAVGYTFKNELLAKEALTHSSYANEFGVRSYERLEFLGDSILSLVVSEYLYENFPDMPEGELTKVRAAAVCERSLYEVASGLSLGKFLFLNKGEEATGGRERISILADIVEATIAAIFLDSGIEEAKKWIMTNVKFVIDKAVSGKAFKDYKTQLQEIAQSGALEAISYRLVDESGPAHMKMFSYEVLSGDKVIGKGSKKEAEQRAAKAALEDIL
ncbi:MAG: ribonuclease III [Clostridia bacterium]|nr:ribonuclease III [Clostridia bacterium]